MGHFSNIRDRSAKRVIGNLQPHLLKSQQPKHKPDLLWLAWGQQPGPLGLASTLGLFSKALAKDCISVLQVTQPLPDSPFRLESMPVLQALQQQQRLRILALHPFPQRQWLLCRPGAGFQRLDPAHKQRLPWPDARWPELWAFQLKCDALRLASVTAATEKVILPWPDQAIDSKADQAQQVVTALTDALFAGLIDSLILPATLALRYVQDLQLELVADISDVAPSRQPATVHAITVPAAFWQHQPKLVLQLLAVLHQTDLWAQQYPAACLDYLSEQTGFKPDLLAALYRHDLHLWFRLSQSPRAFTHLQQLAQLAVQLQFLPQLPDWRKTLLPVGWPSRTA